jgi:hypothetical protein
VLFLDCSFVDCYFEFGVQRALVDAPIATKIVQIKQLKKKKRADV